MGSHSFNAANIPDRIPQKEKLSRQKQILDAQREISILNNRDSIGKTYKVLIDREENEYYIGRSYKDAPEIDQEIYISNSDLKVGEFYNVKVFDAEDFDLFAEVVH